MATGQSEGPGAASCRFNSSHGHTSQKVSVSLSIKLVTILSELSVFVFIKVKKIVWRLVDLP